MNIGIKSLVTVLLLASLSLLACKNESDSQARITFADPDNLASAVVTGTNDPTEVADLFIAEVSQKIGGGKVSSKILAFESAELKKVGSENIVVSVVCSENIPQDDVGAYNSDALFSVLTKNDQEWTFVRFPGEAITQVSRGVASSNMTDLPKAINNQNTLTAGLRLSETLGKDFPPQCKR